MSNTGLTSSYKGDSPNDYKKITKKYQSNSIDFL